MNKDSGNETNDALARLEQEFGPRNASQTDTPAAFGGAVPFAPPPVEGAGGSPRRSVRLRLPVGRPRAVYALLAINVLMYGLTRALTAWYDASAIALPVDTFSFVLLQLGGKYGPAIDRGEYWRFFTPMVLHGGIIHLGFNSYALYALGPEAERIYGTGRFLAIYLLAGFAGSIASYVRSPNLSVGASGAIFGLIGALAAFFYAARSLLGAEASRQQVNQLLGMAAINIVLGFSIPTIDNAAHVGGLVAGALAGFALAPQYRIDDRLYPPVVVRADRPGIRWLMATGLLAVLGAVAALAVGQN